MMPIRRTNNMNWLPSIFDDMFDDNWMFKNTKAAPAVNVIESEKEYKVEIAVPGMTKEDFNVHLDTNNQLVISMEKKSESKNEEGSRYLRREFSHYKFQQLLALPDNVNKEQINAFVKDGVLTINLPKITAEEKAEECKVIEIQ